MCVHAGCISAAEFACTFVQVACRRLSLLVCWCRLHVYSCVCMYICAGCISTATFACTFVQIARCHLRLNVHWLKRVTQSSVPTNQGRSSVPRDQKPRPPTEVSPSVDPFSKILDSRLGFFAKDQDTISGPV